MNLTLLTDFYELTMAYSFWKERMDKRVAVFHHFFRRSPFKGGFAIASGLESLVKFLQEFHFSEDDLSYLKSLKKQNGEPYFPAEFLHYLKNLKFTGDIDAVPEGSVVFPFEPLVRIKGPLLECQLLEGAILNLINFSSLIATKAARICLAAGSDEVFEFGLRRAQGVDGAITASRAAYIGGCAATSNVLAGKLFGIPVKGTHSHSFVMAFADELASFQAYGRSFPDASIFLVDTYNSIEGIKKAIVVANELKRSGHDLVGIRLDSGDLAELSILGRKMLDDAGFKKAKIYASNELDETLISDLKRQGAKINSWGVGTNLVTGKEQTALDGVYKLSVIEGEDGELRDTLKLSEQLLKISNPGVLQVKRFLRDGMAIADMIYDERAKMSTPCHLVDPNDITKDFQFGGGYQSVNLLQPIFREGKLVYHLPTLSEIRERRKKELEMFPSGVKRFLNPHPYMVGMEKSLYDNKINLMKRLRG